MEQDGGKVMRVREIAGSRRVALSALPAILESAGADQAAIKGLASDQELMALVKELGLRTEPHGFDGTVKIIDRPGFFAAFKARMSQKLSPQEARSLTIEAGPPTVLRVGSDTLTVDADEDLAALVFGSIERSAPRASGGLGAVLSKVFPIPLPGYGLDYV